MRSEWSSGVSPEGLTTSVANKASWLSMASTDNGVIEASTALIACSTCSTESASILKPETSMSVPWSVNLVRDISLTV